jgi:hypothetical protein
MEQNIGYIGTTQFYFQIEGVEEQSFKRTFLKKRRGLFNKIKKTNAQ